MGNDIARAFALPAEEALGRDAPEEVLGPADATSTRRAGPRGDPRIDPLLAAATKSFLGGRSTGPTWLSPQAAVLLADGLTCPAPSLQAVGRFGPARRDCRSGAEPSGIRPDMYVSVSEVDHVAGDALDSLPSSPR